MFVLFCVVIVHIPFLFTMDEIDELKRQLVLFVFVFVTIMDMYETYGGNSLCLNPYFPFYCFYWMHCQKPGMFCHTSEGACRTLTPLMPFVCLVSYM